ncbi:type IV pilus biogenesis protein PilM [Pseudomonas alkylphenolica]|uniref:type IV pilus biogenesis protein PilM n=1 Tax=Pseudomonas alkylphenolica TaxID=237609 RepID=UPI0018D92441|nr:pilus assembly protein PilM [Pseudomonas alkylphenolica]MBH3429490.1 pilus assembly protein PilM [Pseudomonas alkylphenolica]
MLGRFGRDAGSLLGVEFTPPFIRLVQLRRQRGRYSVVAWALEPLSEAVMHNGWIGDPEQVGALLLQAVRRSACTTRQVAVALPGGLVIEKVLTVPAGIDEHAIAERLPADAGPFIPYALEDVAMDFQVLGTALGDAQLQRISVAACHQGLLEVLDACLECAGLQVCSVEPDGHALCRAVQVGGEPEALILQIEGDGLVFHEPVGGMLQRRECQLPRHEDIVQSLAAAVDSYVLSHPGRSLPAQVLLCGAGLANGRVPEQLQCRLGIDVRLVNPFTQMALANGIKRQTLLAQASLLAVACGVAMSEGPLCRG